MITVLRRSSRAAKVLLLLGFLTVLIALFPGMFTTYDPNEIDAAAILEGPSIAHPFGTDEVGADVLARVLYATRLELIISLGSVTLAGLVAVPAGLIAGYGARRSDWLFTLVADSILSFPIVLFAVLIVASLGASVTTLLGVLAFVFMPRIFRLVRGQTQLLREADFIRAETAIGLGTGRILFRHILPNIAGPLLVIVPQLMSVAILIEAGLSFLGLGVQPPAISWGTLLLTSKNYYSVAPWYPISVGLVTTAASAALMFGGDIGAAAANPTRRVS